MSYVPFSSGVQPQQTGNPTVTANYPIADLLAAPLGPDWTVEGFAEQVLGALAAQPPEADHAFVLDAETITDRQSRRLLRPLLACLATTSAAEAGTAPKLYGGQFSFKRPSDRGLLWIVGQFENRPGKVCLTLRRSSSPPQTPEAKQGQTAALTDGNAAGEPSPPP